MITHDEPSGMIQMELAPTKEMPTLAAIQRHKVHRAIRLHDELWHYYRYADAQKAQERDRELDAPLMRVSANQEDHSV